jgi:hypothetical protein
MPALVGVNEKPMLTRDRIKPGNVTIAWRRDSNSPNVSTACFLNNLDPPFTSQEGIWSGMLSET